MGVPTATKLWKPEVAVRYLEEIHQVFEGKSGKGPFVQWDAILTTTLVDRGLSTETRIPVGTGMPGEHMYIFLSAYEAQSKPGRRQHTIDSIVAVIEVTEGNESDPRVVTAVKWMNEHYDIHSEKMVGFSHCWKWIVLGDGSLL